MLLTLSDSEKASVGEFGKSMDDLFEEAKKAGVDMEFAQNYVRHQWDREVAQKKISQYENNFKFDPKEANARTFLNYFEGEQAGYKPVNKSMAYQWIAAEHSIREAISTRRAIKDLLNDINDDGRPTIAVGDKGKVISADHFNKSKWTEPHNDLDYTGYKYLDHPSLRGWQYYTNVEGATQPVLMEGNAWIHPDHYHDLNALLGKSAIKTLKIPDNIPVVGGMYIGQKALKVSSFAKGTMLVGPFHLSHVSQHAAFHKVNPFELREIDFKARPTLKEGVDAGLMLSERQGLQAFSEGNTSGGLWEHLPTKYGRAASAKLKQFNEFTFQEFIPKLKAEMFERAFEENLERYKGDMVSGKLSRKQIAEITANQSNAAFGELNYKYMGRNKTLQDIWRLTTLAPDFLEARLRFAGQALRPYGREQQLALARSAITYTAIAQTVNMIYSQLSGESYNAEERMKRPFTIKWGDREITPRSVAGDVSHLASDQRSFINSRLNPLTTKPIKELWEGRDIFGRKQDVSGILMDTAKGLAPIPSQEFLKGSGDPLFDKIIHTALQMVGLSNYKYRSEGENSYLKIRLKSIKHLKIDEPRR